MSKGKETNRPSTTVKQETTHGSLYATVTRSAGKTSRVFLTIGKAGGEVAYFTEALARVISLALQSGTAMHEITSALAGCGGDDELLPTVPHGVSMALGYQPTEDK